MKIWTPPKDIVVPSIAFVNGVLQTPEDIANPKYAGYYHLSFYMKDGAGGWEHHQEVQYHEKPPKELKIMFPRQFSKPPEISIMWGVANAGKSSQSSSSEGNVDSSQC